MECKERYVEEIGVEAACINRNIVECKGEKEYIVPIDNIVLIETSWNVKLSQSFFQAAELKY